MKKDKELGKMLNQKVDKEFIKACWEKLKIWWKGVDKVKLKAVLLSYIPMLMVIINGLIINSNAIIGKIAFEFGHTGINNTLLFVIAFFLLILPLGYVFVNLFVTAVPMFFFILNEYVTESRDRPLNFNDIYCVNDAMAVSSKYPFEFTDKMRSVAILAAVSFVITTIIIIIARIRFKPPEKRLKPIAGAVLFSLTALNLLISTPGAKVLIPWNEQEFVEQSGLFKALYSEYLSSRLMEPVGYSKDKCEKMLSESPTEGDPEKMPTNIIVIMNESLADYSLVYDIYENGFSEDPLPLIHQLSDNCAKGRLAVNIFGSSTCNSEFEMLTGYSVSFLPQRSMPYVQYNLIDLPNLARDAAAAGFRTTALHGYFGQEYKRELIYSNWCTDPFISAEDFSENYVEIDDKNLFQVNHNFLDAPNFGDDLEYVNRFISDAECYRKTFEKVKEDNAAGKNSFMFDVTIQNHGGYEEYTGDYELIDYTRYKSANVYLSLSHVSDKAFTDFLEELRNYPEKTVVVMFGDHQPALFFHLLNKQMPETDNPYEEMSYRYTVPYILWANYDMEWDVPEYFSLSYLSAVLKKNIGMPLDTFDQVRLKAMEDYPVLSYEFACNKDGEIVAPESVTDSENVRNYMALQYYEMFDK